MQGTYRQKEGWCMCVYEGAGVCVCVKGSLTRPAHANAVQVLRSDEVEVLRPSNIQLLKDGSVKLGQLGVSQ